MPAAAPPPAAPPAAPAAPPASPPSDAQIAARAAQTTVHVRAVPDAGKVPDPVRPGSARERVMKDLQSKAKIDGAPPAEDATPTVVTPPKSDEAPPKAADEAPPSGEKPAGETPPADGAKTPAGDKKVSPWRLVDQYKEKTKALETEVAELRKGKVEPKQLQDLTTRAEAAEKRMKELENEIAFYDYSKSSEFTEKYQKPYEQAWTKAMSELKELTIADAAGNERPITADDLLSIVNMPLKQARSFADEAFGPFADDVMNHRASIRSMLEQRQSALDNAHKNGAAELRKRMEQQQQARTQVLKEIGETWTAVNSDIAADPKVGAYFKPVEGDEDGNGRLERGFKFVDEAFSLNPEDPKLTPEQRKEVIKKHAAVRNRAAAFGRLRHQNETLLSRIAEMEKKLKAYEGSEPPTAGRETAPSAATGHMSARDQVIAELQKRAH